MRVVAGRARYADREGDRHEVRVPSGDAAVGYASLKATATDHAGNKVTETVIRAYALR